MYILLKGHEKFIWIDCLLKEGGLTNVSIASQGCTVSYKKSFDCNKAISPTSSRSLQFGSTTPLVPLHKG